MPRSNDSFGASSSSQKLPLVTQENIATVRDIEDGFLQQRTTGTRVGDAVARFAGSATFLVLNAAWYIVWIVANMGWIPRVHPFDPYPFTFLTLMVSLEAIFLTIFVLASQNHMTRVADQRGHLAFQISMLSEQENTKMLHLLVSIAEHLGLQAQLNDKELSELAEKTEPAALIEELEKQLPKQ